MNESLQSKVATLARAQFAMALTVADGMQRYAGLTLRFGETCARALDTIVRESGELKGHGGNQAAASALAGYRDYVRGLAALPGLASMHYYDQLGLLRAAAGVQGAPVTRTPQLTESMLSAAPGLGSLEAAGPSPPPAQSPAQPKGSPGKKRR
jgi:hypothetical protein